MADLYPAQRSDDLPSISPEGNGEIHQTVESLESLLSDSGEDADEQPPVRETGRVNRKRRGDRAVVPSSAVLKEMETIKMGYLDHAGRTFQRWSKKYLRIVGGRLYISKTPEDKLCEQIVLKDAIVAENSTKNVNHSFTVLTPSHQVGFAGSSRKEMESWISAFRVAASKTPTLDIIQHLEGHHSWVDSSHSRPTYCNVCKEALHGMAWHGLSCEVCKIKSHRRCVFQVKEKCKWTTRSSLEQADVKIGYDYSIPHQWLEGNLPNGSKCAVCLRACGSVRRLQDFRCLWCKWTVHTECMDKVEKKCTLGDLHLSILPPSILQRSDAIKKAMWEPYKMIGHSPVLALVNSKSGDNQGVRFLRKLKYWLNPVQVFDLAITGPDLGLQLFQRFEKFRILVFGGDGSIGWVLSAVDRFNLHSKTMLGVVPLGTGNDMARVMGWGAQFGDEEKLPTILKEMECSSFHLLDRWSVQFSKGDVDMSPIVEATTPSITGRPPMSSHLDIPLPGPGSSPKDPVFSPSSSNSDSEYKSAVSQTPSPEPGGPVENLVNPPGGSNNSSPVDYDHGDAVDEDGLEVCTLPKQTYETWELSLNSHTGVEREPEDVSGMAQDPEKLASFQHSVAAHLSTILLSQNEAAVLSSAGVIYQVVSDFISSVLVDRKKKLATPEYRDDPLVQQCTVLQQKLKGLLNTLKDEAKAATEQKEEEGKSGKIFRPRDILMARANSLKKAMRNVIDMTEKEVDSQAQVTAEHSSLMQPVSEEPTQVSPNLSPSSSQSSIDSGPPQRGRMSVSSQGSATIGSVVDPVPVLRETEEMACMNNYFGIGVDAQIAYQFHTTREKNPAQYKSRTKNKMLYGLLAGKEFTANLHKNLERKISLECDGKRVILPSRLQGLVFLNIPSYMAGTNFWGTDKEKKGFSAPSYDDKLMEVACITGFTQVATAKVLGIQNRRLAQCRYAKITLHEQLPVQVDGEAWLQGAGIVVISHKNKARMIVRDKTFSQSLESWKQKNPSATTSSACLPIVSKPVGLLDFLTEDDIERYRAMAKTAVTLMELIKLEAAGNSDMSSTLVPLLASTSSSLERIFPDDYQVSETADLQHVQDFEREVKALMQETLWILNVKKVSAERERDIRGCVRTLESHVREILSRDLLGSHEYRRASDTLLTSKRPQDSPSAHRGRAALMVPDTTLTAASVAKKIGKEVEDWDTGDVCWWLGRLGLDGYDEKIHTHSITGKQLLNLQTSDFQDLGITKVGHLTKLRAGIQALNPSIHNSPTTMKRGKPTRETR